MKVKIIKRIDRQTVSAANSGENHKSKGPVAEKSISKAVNSWITELRQKSESDAALFRKMFKPENRLTKR